MDLDYGMLGGRRPYYRFGDADADPLVVLPGLSDAFQRIDPNRGTAAALAALFREFDDRDVWVVGRSRHLPVGSTTRDMAAGYAGVIDEQDLWPADVIAPALIEAAGRVVDFRPAVPADAVVSCTACLEHDSREILGDIDASTLVAAGKADRLFPEPRIRELKGGVADATLALFSGAGHDLATSEPRTLNGVVRRYFDGFRGDGLYP